MKITLNKGIVSLLLLAGTLIYLVANKTNSLTITLIIALFLLFYLLIVIKPKFVP